MAEPLTRSKTGRHCNAILPAHHPLDGQGYNGPATCASHAEHVELGLPHVCCCGYEHLDGTPDV